jgi:hypothetical protein
MLKIRPIMNSSVEDIFAFKTCCGMGTFDQNLEIHLTNLGDRPVVIPSYFDLVGSLGQHRINTLMPHGDQRIGPGETIAFYCTMDETLWKAAKQIIFYDSEGNSHPVDVTGWGGNEIDNEKSGIGGE